MAQHQRKNPAPIVADTRDHVVYDLIDRCGNPVRKFPHRSDKSNLTILRFTAPNRKNPEGMVIAAGHAPFSPAKIGMLIAPRS